MVKMVESRFGEESGIGTGGLNGPPQSGKSIRLSPTCLASMADSTKTAGHSIQKPPSGREFAKLRLTFPLAQPML